MHCVKCNSEITSSAKYCRICGEKQIIKYDSDSDSGKNYVSKKRCNKIYIGILISISIIIGFAAGYHFIKIKYQKKIEILTFENTKLENLVLNNSRGIKKSGVYILRAKYENIGNIKKGSLVKSSGMQIGVVSNLKFNTENYEAEVEMEINEEFKFPQDTLATIYTDCAEGNPYISLNAGGAANFLKNGDTITETQSALSMEQLTSQILYNKASEQAEKQ
jgi:phospholipid/cholesterol/gamma-HCH transport system substrate-binding protein